VTRGGEEVKLSSKEFSLLHFLIRRAGHVVPRHTLIEGVWGYDSSIASNTLDAFIHLLRSKVDAAPHARLIHTVRGVGYCLRQEPPR
jgi:DNA-binding response OmpR family regulator